MLQQNGLYYPYIHFRDESWLKAAALYWPSLGRVVPDGYPVMDSPTVRRLSEGLPGFVHDVDPAAAARSVAEDFLEVLTGDPAVLRGLRDAHANFEELAGAPGVGPGVGPGTNGFPDFGSRRHGMPTVSRDPAPDRMRRSGLAGVYRGEVDPRLRAALTDSGLALPARSARFRGVADAGFLAMSPELAWVYKCALTEELARLGGYAPTTDHTASHTASQGWDAERIARALLDRGSAPGFRPPDTVDGGLVDAVGMLAVRIVLPADLHRVDIEKIIELRTTHAAAFDRFGQAVTDTAEALKSDLADVLLPQAARRYLEREVDRRFRIPLADLEDAVRSLNGDTVFSAANVAFTLPPLLGLAVGQFSGNPAVATGLGAAFGITGAVRGARQRKRAALAGSPVAYLLSVKRELAPAQLLRRITARVRGRD
ncbi:MULTISPECIES: DUF6236 family protein [unclassified Streptomyces]|uniref:DUF6236 family protein n=1 Tax=unclassified Streptomyces TaxID=2593676 RepID=UPI000DC7EE0B|nr:MULTISPECIES: DUF6236 family protein [unclassified Streptomyces]AWZ08826.1 hypothetical protein DRB89_34610 [Streptomyces sp. ICC4]AWZ15832.1 hypothetical protein DRB96_30250 [Streptomyces sp. ICC1]